MTKPDGLIGTITSNRYRIEVRLTADAPKLALTGGKWIYITKIYSDGSIGEKSLGLPESDLPVLVELLQKAMAAK